VDLAGLEGAMAELRSPGALGANLTVPHKVSALELVDELEQEAARIGAVNTVVNYQGTLRGYNTDLGGFLAALRVTKERGANGLDCLVIGAGGAARAVVAGLVQDGAVCIWVSNRTQERAEELCEIASTWGDTSCVPLAPDQVAKVTGDCQLIINATSVGLPASVKELPIDVDTLHSGQVLIDLVYGTRPTVLVEAARARGLVAVDGKEMLVRQAALSFQLWTGLEAPIEVMRRSIGGC
jgi:shikimate dehydrogenase